MKVRELIEELKNLNQDRDITVDGATIKGFSRATDVENGEHFYIIEL